MIQRVSALVSMLAVMPTMAWSVDTPNGYIPGPALSAPVGGGVVAKAALAALPASVDMSAWMPPVGYQGSNNSCVAWGLSYGLMGFYARKYG